MDIDQADIRDYAILAGVFVFIAVVVEVFVWHSLGEESRDRGSSIMVGLLIALAVVFMGMMRNRRTANIERMVRALYDHFGLDDAKAGGRCDKCGRGGASRGGEGGTEGEKEGPNGG